MYPGSRAADDGLGRLDRASSDDRLFLGWQHALLQPDPGEPPRRPTPPEQQHVHPEWAEEQRREESRLNRPLLVVSGMSLIMAVLLGLLGWPVGVIPGWGAAVAIGVCLVLAGVAGYAMWQGEQALRIRLDQERVRMEHLRDERDRKLRVAHDEHVSHFDAWRSRKAAYDAQYSWYPVLLPRDVDRLDVAGGTPAGWSALITTLGASRIDAGGGVIVADFGQDMVARDLVTLASDRGSRAWTPDDLSRLDLGADSAQLHVVSGADGPPGGEAGVADALRRELRRSPRGEPWSRTLFVCGAERLAGETLDGLFDVCASSGTGLVTMYGSLPAQVRERLGGSAQRPGAVCFMRPGSAEEARIAVEYLGSHHRCVLNQLTESVDAALTRRPATSYADAQARGASDSGTGSLPGAPALIRQAAAATRWARVTSSVLEAEESGSADIRRSREFLTEQHELRRLPGSAFILRHAGGGGLVSGDANPAIAGLPQTTHRDLTEARREMEQTYSVEGAGWASSSSDPGQDDGPDQSEFHRDEEERDGEDAGEADSRTSGARPTREELADLPPNLGPPPERLDWRRGR